MRISLLSGLVAAAFLSACSAQVPSGPDPNAPVPVGVIAVRTEPVNLTTELSGRTSASLVSEVRPQVNGVIKARLFQEGAIVRAGQPLYQIDPATYRASLDSAVAALAQAEAAATAARLTPDVQAQRAAVQQARINVDYARVHAPISGRISRSSVTPGALVTANQATPLATIQNLETIYVDVTQSAADLLKLRQAMAAGDLEAPGTAQVRLILEDGSIYPHPGRLAFSDITVDPGTGSIGLRAIFPNPEGALLPGLYVRARLAEGVATQAILAPPAAVSWASGGEVSSLGCGPSFWGGTGLLGRRMAGGPSAGGGWSLTGGLRPGERIIVEGLQGVRPGSAVKPAPATAAAPATAR